jgi:hypothetical protein
MRPHYDGRREAQHARGERGERNWPHEALVGGLVDAVDLV